MLWTSQKNKSVLFFFRGSISRKQLFPEFQPTAVGFAIRCEIPWNSNEFSSKFARKTTNSIEILQRFSNFSFNSATTEKSPNVAEMLRSERCKSWNPKWKSLEKPPSKSQRKNAQVCKSCRARQELSKLFQRVFPCKKSASIQPRTSLSKVPTTSKRIIANVLQMLI